MKTQTRHTQGPWFEEHGFIFSRPTNQAIAEVVLDEDTAQDTDEWEANRRLIAAAPDMLDMLEAIRARLSGEWDNPALLKWGALHPNAEWDICERIDTILNRINQ